MELLPLGPIVMIDTPGLDDEGELGKLRIQKAYQVLNKTDIAVLVIDGTSGITPQDNAILTRIQDKNIPLLLVLNKADLVSEHTHQEMIVSTHLKYKIPLEHILWTNTTENLHIPFFLQDIRGIWEPSSTAQEHWTRWKTEIRS